MPDALATDAARRAPALPLADRREMIIEAVVPLIVEHGRDVTSRQIAEAAGIAEGTVFRAFGDKETLLQAAAERFFDVETVRRGLRAIDPDDPVDVKVAEILRLMRRRFSGAMKVMSVTGGVRPAPSGDPAELDRILERIFEPDLDRLAWSPQRVLHLVRLLSFASSVPEIASADAPFTVEELAAMVTHGVLADAQAHTREHAAHTPPPHSPTQGDPA
jgi:AcrR family transcriptional regulator